MHVFIDFQLRFKAFAASYVVLNWTVNVNNKNLIITNTN